MWACNPNAIFSRVRTANPGKFQPKRYLHSSRWRFEGYPHKSNGCRGGAWRRSVPKQGMNLDLDRKVMPDRGLVWFGRLQVDDKRRARRVVMGFQRSRLGQWMMPT